MSRYNVMPRAYRLQQQAQDLDHVLRIIGQSTAPEDSKTYTNTPAGDARKLRGIPAIGRGVTGAIPGTNPSDCIL